jgi:two-component system nitrate/nitrite sensor histidine kinase NarX
MLSANRIGRRPAKDVDATRTVAMPSSAREYPAAGNETGAVLAGFLGLVVRLTHAQAGAVRVLTSDGASLRLIASVGLSDAVREREALMPAACGMCGAALRDDDTRGATVAVGCALRGVDGMQSIVTERAIAVPLDFQHRPIGVLNLFFAGAHSVPEGAAQLFRPFGLVLGLALENERLAQENLQAHVAAERQTMAAELHDALAQSMTFARMRMSLLEEAVRQGDTANALACTADVNGELRGAHARLRDIIRHFRAGMDSRGLLASLREAASTFESRYGIALRFDCALTRLDVTDEQELQLYHIVQEALANIRKHAQARQASVTMAQSGGELKVTIEDDGRGADELMLTHANAGILSDRGHFGLQIMRERAVRAGGGLRIERRPEAGVRVTVTLPLVPAGNKR